MFYFEMYIYTLKIFKYDTIIFLFEIINGFIKDKALYVKENIR